ncbi:MAG: Ig-like domain-containing protein [Clostridia bacterium]|nr:Ig-like domain-containing protein [Clostridia bacterium]
MNHRQIAFRRLVITLLAVSMLLIPAFAAEITVSGLSSYCFANADFTQDEADVEGIYLISVPSGTQGQVLYGTRTLRSGDVIPSDGLGMISLRPAETCRGSCEIVYSPICAGSLGQKQTLKLRLLGDKDQAPVCADSAFETYKNIANSGTLKATDDSGQALTYQIVREPSRGTVELHEDGSFTYTPNHNKVGKDSFTFTAADAAGNVSNEACVKIRIVKPTDKAMYTDMQDDRDAYLAMWLKDQGVYTGKTVAGNLCFEPEGTVSRGEFLIMTMQLLGTQKDDAALTSGFADEEQTPNWMRPFIVSALRNGMITGVNSENGLVFRPQAALTRAEAAVMLQNILELPKSDSRSVFSSIDETAVPVWAADAVDALSNAGIEITRLDAAEPITRLEAGRLLYKAWELSQQTDLSEFEHAK